MTDSAGSGHLGAPERGGRAGWITLLGALAIAAPRLVTAACSDPFYDERTVFDLGRLAFSPCVSILEVPWDQPPLANLVLYLLHPLARVRGLSDGVALDLPLVVGRLLIAAAPSTAWLMLRRALHPGLPRAAFFVVCLLSAASLELSSLAMNNGIVALPIVVALGCFGGLGPPGRRGLALGGAALAVATGTSFVAWPAAAAMGGALLWVLWRRPDASPGRPWVESLLAVGPSALVAVAWLVVSLAQSGHFDTRISLYQSAGLFDPLRTFWQTQLWYVFGRELHHQPSPGALAVAVSSVGTVGWLGLAVVGTLDRGEGALPWRRLRPVLIGLAWGTWLVVLALIPLVWLGKAKFYLLLLAPMSLLACGGFAALARSRCRSARVAGVIAAVAVTASLFAGLVRSPVCWDRSYQERRFYTPLPRQWSCPDRWIPSLEEAQEQEQTILPSTGKIVCDTGGPCSQPGWRRHE